MWVRAQRLHVYPAWVNTRQGYPQESGHSLGQLLSNLMGLVSSSLFVNWAHTLHTHCQHTDPGNRGFVCGTVVCTIRGKTQQASLAIRSLWLIIFHGGSNTMTHTHNYLSVESRHGRWWGHEERIWPGVPWWFYWTHSNRRGKAHLAAFFICTTPFQIGVNIELLMVTELTKLITSPDVMLPINSHSRTLFSLAQQKPPLSQPARLLCSTVGLRNQTKRQLYKWRHCTTINDVTDSLYYRGFTF